MKLFFARLAVLLLLPFSPALALEQASSPQKFPIAWGASAGTAYVRSIPTPSQIGVQNCAASLTDGFPPLTFVPASGGGCPPFGQDFNGILRQLSQWSQWGQAGGPVYYDSAFASAINGYPSGARLLSTIVPGTVWVSTADNNTSNPDAGGSGWIQDPGRFQTGDIKASSSTMIQPGWAAANGLTIGNAASGATNRAGAETQLLFAFLWGTCPDSQCPVSGGRGASAAADFAANKTIVLLDLRGTGQTGVDTMQGNPSTRLAGVPIISGIGTNAPGTIMGENLHALTPGENGTHAHASTLTDPGHLHASTLTDPGHVHTTGITDPGHAHANTVTDPGHVHTNTLTDPGHGHNNIITQAQFPISSGGTGPFLFGASIGGGASANLVVTNTTGITISVNSHATGVSLNNASAVTGVGVAVNSHATGLSINNATAATGLSINNASSGSSTPHNNVMRSFLVYWNIKL